MRYKLLGNSGLRVSELALGTMTFGDENGHGVADETVSRKLFDAFLEAGGNAKLPSKAKGRVFQANRAFSGQSHLPPNVPMVMSLSWYVHVCARPPQKRLSTWG